MKYCALIIFWSIFFSVNAQPFQEQNFYFSLHAVKDIITSDLDQDGDLDFIVFEDEEDKIAWFEYVGNGQFLPHLITENIFAGNLFVNAYNTEGSLFVDDYDSDGDMDILINNNMTVFQNDGNQIFTQQILFVPDDPDNFRPSRLQSADINEDGFIDLVAIHAHKDRIVWYENDGNQNYTEHEVSNSIDFPYQLEIDDLNNDGHQDIIFSSHFEELIGWFENDGFGNFTIRTINNNQPYTEDINITDIDGDGDKDMIAGGWCQSFTWLKNNGSESFDEFFVADVNSNLGCIYDVASGDLDNDGDIDILIGTSGYNDLKWYENEGNDSFIEHLIPFNHSLSNVSEAVQIGDIDGDGWNDIISVQSHCSRVVWHKNNGNKTFTEKTVNFSVGANYVCQLRVEFQAILLKLEKKSASKLEKV